MNEVSTLSNSRLISPSATEEMPCSLDSPNKGLINPNYPISLMNSGIGLLFLNASLILGFNLVWE